MSQNPYRLLPQYTRWSKAVASVDYNLVDPVTNFPFKITRSEKVATAGSCFAQHIARHLKKNKFSYYVAEDGHPLGNEELKTEFNYGVFSARYANIYTSRQLLQLFQRAYGAFVPLEDHWTTLDNKLVDPLRPTIQPNGFSSLQELRADRSQHLSCVKNMFENLDYFVFTLGLTEYWQDNRDGTAFPVCPGVSGGEFDDSKFSLVNLKTSEIVSDMITFIHSLLQVNPNAKIILTVSPVPLIATAVDRHALVSTTYSKSALRASCEELCEKFSNVAYFPSFEIITGSYTHSRYFASDLRSVTEEGVRHVMGLFQKHVTNSISEKKLPEPLNHNIESEKFIASMSNVVQTLCEEELIEQSFDK